MLCVFVIILALTGCVYNNTLAPNMPRSTLSPPAHTLAAQFLAASQLGDVHSHRITEVSGICASRELKNILYVHNDKGDGPKLYAISSLTGHYMKTLHVLGAHNYDWEDIACGPCDTNGGSCIYVGDIGDHSGDGPRNIIYKIREPTSFPNDANDMNVVVEAELHFSWEHYSEQPDAETLMVDPYGDIYVITKVQGGHGEVGRIPVSAWSSGAPLSVHPSETMTLLISSSKPDPSGGDISPDGREILIKSHTQVFHWFVAPGQSIMNVLATPPISVSYHKEHNGEAIGWAENGMGYYTLSEGHNQMLYYYARG